MSFSTRDLVFLKVSPMKAVMRFGKKGKLTPRYIEPFEIRSKVGEVAYRLVLPPELSWIHPVFHVSMLRKYISDSSHVDRKLSSWLDKPPSQLLEITMVRALILSFYL